MQDRRKEIDSVSHCLPRLKYAKEFGTIKLCTARGCGHTSALAKIIEEKFDKAIVVFHTLKISAIFQKQYPNIKNKITIITPETFDKLWGHADVDVVIVDCCSLLSQSKIDELYDITAYAMKNPMYILME